MKTGTLKKGGSIQKKNAPKQISSGKLVNALGSLFEAYMLEALGDGSLEFKAIVTAGRKEWQQADEQLAAIKFDEYRERIQKVARDAASGLSKKIKDTVIATIKAASSEAEAIGILARIDLPGNTPQGDLFAYPVILELKYSSSPGIKYWTTSLNSHFDLEPNAFADFLQIDKTTGKGEGAALLWHNWAAYPDKKTGDKKWASQVATKGFQKFYYSFASQNNNEEVVSYFLRKGESGNTNKKIIAGFKADLKADKEENSPCYMSVTIDIDAVIEQLGQGEIDLVKDSATYMSVAGQVLRINTTDKFKEQLNKIALANLPGDDFPKTTQIEVRSNAFVLYAIQKITNS